jgi:hypothetical protein
MRIFASVVYCILIGVFVADAQTSQSITGIVSRCEQEARQRVANTQAAYGTDLNSLKSFYQAKGELENFLAVKNEQNRFKKEGLVQETDLVNSPEGLRKLQVKYQLAGQQAVKQYLAELETKKKMMTAAGQVDLAIGVKDAIEKIRQRYSGAGSSEDSFARAIVGKWRESIGSSWSSIYTFSADGSAYCEKKAVRGRWVLKDGKVIVTWANGATDTITFVSPRETTWLNNAGSNGVARKLE